MVCLRGRVALFVFSASIALGAFAQSGSQIGDCPFDRPLIEPPVIDAVGGKVETTLTLRMANVKVPFWRNIAAFGQPAVYQCSMTTMNLRQYSWPFPGGVTSGFPGPTLRLHKAPSPQATGDSLTVHLVNELPIAPNDQCSVGCDCSNPNALPRCCTAPDVFPACFHGDNNTNLHFHGTHVSPQPPQDYVLLELRPKGSSTDSMGTHEHGLVRAGSYDYVVDPFRYRQPEGTHWYHPHKHGSTALQVGNGLAGALIILGKFDDDLRALYGGNLKENLLVLQLIHEVNNFVVSNTVTTQPLINGQPSPVIDMYPGEIRRLRFISATMQADGAVTIDWNGPADNAVDVRQIAFDGVQFAPENYDRQPMLSTGKEVDLAPGNRADFLVKAPAAEGTYDVTYILKVPEGGAAGGDSNLKAVAQAIAPGSAEPRLFRIRVTACANPQACPAMSFPPMADFPKLPPYLADIPESEVAVRRNLLFELKGGGGGGALPPDQIPSQPSKFFINLAPNEQRQFNPSCMDITNRLGQVQQWTLYNTSARQPIKPLHIFHIHTNAFQIINHPLKPKLNTPPYVWADSVLLTDSTQPPITIRLRFEDFTGAFVLHCHFLGHEDRGMMLGVQVVCPDNTSKFGAPAAAGGPDDCRPPALIDALPSCDVFTPRHRGAGH